MVELRVFFYKSSGGSIGGRLRGAPVLLLTTLGRKTGKRRTTPLMYIIEGSSYIVVASNGGRAKDPSWWSNLKKNPQAEIQVRRDVKKMSARQASTEEKVKFWPVVTKMCPTYNEYQKKTVREIPVVILDAVGAA